MHDDEWDDLDLDSEGDDPLLLDGPGTSEIPEPEPVFDSLNPWPYGLAAVMLALIAAGYLYFWFGRSVPEPAPAAEPMQPRAAETLPEQPPEEEEAPEPTTFVVPLLADSDTAVRELVELLSSSPTLATWLADEHLVRRFVAAVDNVADGVSPRAHVMSMAPQEKFAVLRQNGATFIDPESYRRYDGIVDTFVSLDVEGSVELYQNLKPLLQEAYLELGNPEGDFDERTRQAITHLLATPAVEGYIELDPVSVSYQLMEPRLEHLSPAQKHLLRMGPRNTRRVQRKLRDFAAALQFGAL